MKTEECRHLFDFHIPFSAENFWGECDICVSCGDTALERMDKKDETLSTVRAKRIEKNECDSCGKKIGLQMHVNPSISTNPELKVEILFCEACDFLGIIVENRVMRII